MPISKQEMEERKKRIIEKAIGHFDKYGAKRPIFGFELSKITGEESHTSVAFLRRDRRNFDVFSLYELCDLDETAVRSYHALRQIVQEVARNRWSLPPQVRIDYQTITIYYAGISHEDGRQVLKEDMKALTYATRERWKADRESIDKILSKS